MFLVLTNCPSALLRVTTLDLALDSTLPNATLIKEQYENWSAKVIENYIQTPDVEIIFKKND
jgi:hypothetical protein